MGALDQSNSKFKSIYRVSDAQPNWAQTDPSQPDYIKNRDLAQEVRPILVNGEEFLSNEVESGALNLVAGGNVTLTTDGNNLIISSNGTGGGGSDQPVDCDCPEYIGGFGINISETDNGKRVVKLANEGITEQQLADESVTSEKIASSAVGSKHVVENAILSRHLQVGSVQTRNIATGAIQNYHLSDGIIEDRNIKSISFSKIVQDENDVLILNGGKANGTN